MAAKSAVRPIAMGVGAIRMGATGDGVPGTELKELPLPTKGSVAFNFADPKEVKIETEGTNDPLFVELVKDTTDYIEFSIPTPTNELIKDLCGGEIEAGTEGEPKDIWKEPTEVASIERTFQCETLPKKGHKVIYTIVNGKVMAKISQAPGAEQAELLLVRVYKQSAISAAGAKGYAFSREVVKIA